MSARSRTRASGSNLCLSKIVGCLVQDFASWSFLSLILHTISLGLTRTSLNLKGERKAKLRQHTNPKSHRYYFLEVSAKTHKPLLWNGAAEKQEWRHFPSSRTWRPTADLPRGRGVLFVPVWVFGACLSVPLRITYNSLSGTHLPLPGSPMSSLDARVPQGPESLELSQLFSALLTSTPFLHIHCSYQW